VARLNQKRIIKRSNWLLDMYTQFTDRQFPLVALEPVDGKPG
jgi:hypothetical protein